ncbi:phosphatase PAP2 family protein [Streptomyces panaciradicis]|uniref:phosphatase PAP2 family protein n=1 Tax=Streptomyces panaciradicis TaxID=1470261 RepID=UPI00201CFE59|nr:phosphatase PAP2 family protein [Streptomyces panaciradicis]MCL6670841.1 phosphatase PAP2 family protein [Streptomyces panaciradicis]
MRVLTELREGDRIVTRRVAVRMPARVGKALTMVEKAAQKTKLWCCAAGTMALFGGRRGRRAAAGGLGAVVVAQVICSGLCKRLNDRPRPPAEWFPHDEVEDRPDSSSFPSGHTAVAAAFAGAVVPAWPVAGALCAVPAALVAVERVWSGAHYPTDVAAGAAIGLASAALGRSTPRLLRRSLTGWCRTGQRSPRPPDKRPVAYGRWTRSA